VDGGQLVNQESQTAPYFVVFLGNLFMGFIYMLFVFLQSKPLYPIRSWWAVLLSLLLSSLLFSGVWMNQSSVLMTYPDWVSLYGLVIFVGLYAFLFFLVSQLFYLLDSVTAKPIKCSIPTGLGILFEVKVFFLTFLLILFGWLPYIVGWYPGILSYDASVQILQAFGKPTSLIPGTNVLSPVIQITNVHPYLHTMFISSLVRFGEVVGDFNLGLFFVTISQIILHLFGISLIFLYFYRSGLSRLFLIFFVSYFALSPMIPLFTVSIVKDIHFSAFFTLFVFSIFLYLRRVSGVSNPRSLSLYYAFLILMALPVIYFRHTGIFIVLLTFFVLVCFVPAFRRVGLVFMFALSGTFYFYNAFGLPLLNVSPAPSSAMYTVPFQQTARLAKYSPETMTQKDRLVISKILPIDQIAELYSPTYADSVKGFYNRTATPQDFSNYFLVWGKGMVNRPDIYIDSVWENVYLFYAPLSLERTGRIRPSKFVRQHGLNYQYGPHDKGLRRTATLLFEGSKFFSVVGLLTNVGFSTWLVFTLLAYMLYKRYWTGVLAFVPLLLFVLFYATYPSNGSVRHGITIIYSLPLMLGIVLLSGSRNPKQIS
jgi:hypothetical protein